MNDDDDGDGDDDDDGDGGDDDNDAGFFLLQDFDLQALQRRLSRMEGEQSNEEKVSHEARVRELTKLLREKTSIRTLLTGENKRQQVRSD